MKARLSSPPKLRRRLTIPISKRASLFTLSMALLLSGKSTQAATRTFDGGPTGTGTDLNAAVNWSADTKPTTTDEAEFSTVTGAGSPLTTTGNNQVFGDLLWNSNTSNSITINTSTANNNSITLSGGGGFTQAIADGGATGDLLLMGTNATTSTLTIGGNAGAGTGRLTLAVGANGNFDVVNSGATLNLTAGITGNFTVTKTGAGTLVLGGANTFTGFTTSAGVTTLTNQLALQSATVTRNGGSIVFDSSVAGNAFTFGSLAATGSGANFDLALQNNAGSPAAVALTVGNSTSTTYAGVLSASGSLTKVGTGTLTLSGANTYTGATTVSSGTLTVSGAAGSIASSSGLTISGNGVAATGINSSGFFILDKSNGTAVDSLNNSNLTAITLGTGGEFRLTNTTNANSTETVGNIVIGAGSSTITVIAPTTGITTLASTGSLLRTGSGTALLRGTNFAQQSTTSAGRITVATAPSGADFVGTNTLNNGATNDATQALKIVPWLLGDVTATATGTRFVTYDSTLGFRALLSGEAPALTAGSTTQAAPINATVATGTTTVTTPNLTVNSLMLSAATSTLDGSGSLTVNSGAVGATFNATNSDVIGSGWSSLALGNGEGILHVITGNTLTINTGISVFGAGTGGLTKAEAGNLILNGVNTYTGPTTINQGNLTIGGAGQLNSGNYAGAITNPGNGNFTYGSSADQTLSGGVSLGTAGLIKSGTGNLTISTVAATYTGATTINGGTLTYGINQATPNAGAVTINATTASGSATLDLAGFNSTVSSLTFGGTTAGANAVNNVTTGAGTLTLGLGSIAYTAATLPANDPGDATLSGNLDLGGASRIFTIANSTKSTNELTISALIGPSSGGGIRKTGAGTLTLSNTANSFTGAFSVEGGTANVASLANGGMASSIGSASSAIIFDAGAILQYTAGNGPQSTNRGETINGAGGGIDASGATTSDTLAFTVLATGSGNTARNFVLTGSNTGVNSFAGINQTAAGAISLVKSGTGSWTVNGASTYTGTTSVSGGTLMVDSAGATTARLASTTGVNISGGILQLANSTATASTDRINNAATVTLNGGTLNTGGLSEGLATGASAATPGLGALTLNSTSTLDFGAGHIGSSVLAFADSSTQAWTGTLNLTNFTPGTDELNFATGTGLNSTQLSEISLPGYTASGLDSFGDVTFTVAPVPEPSTIVGMLGLVGLLGYRERKRFRSVRKLASRS